MTSDRCRLPSPGGLRQSKKERTRAALVEAGSRLVREHGYEATTVELIAGAADVSVRTFHNYFPSKAALFAEGAVGFIGEYAEALAAQPDELGCLDALCAAWLVLLDEHGAEIDAHRGMLEVLEMHPEIKARVLESAPEAIAPVRAEIARRASVGSPDSIAAWIGAELTFATAAFVLHAPAHGVAGHDDPASLIRDAFAGVAALVTAPPPARGTSPTP